MKKLLVLLMVAMLALPSFAALADGGYAPIGTADAPVVVRAVMKDVDPTAEKIVGMCAELQRRMAAHGQYVVLDIIEAPAGTYGTAIPLALSTGELEADLIYFQGNDITCKNLGLLEDMTEYLDKSQYIKSIMYEYNAERFANYPYLLWLSWSTTYIPIMREDHLTAIGMLDTLQNDPSVENYHTALKRLVDEGYVKYAFSGDGSMARANHMFNNAFGITSTIMKDAEGKYVYSIATQAQKDLLAFYAQCYKEGLIDPDYLTSSWSNVQKKFYAGDLAMFCATQGDVVDSYCTKITVNQGENARGVVLPPAGGVSYIATSVAKETRGYAINADSEQQVKDAAFAILDFMASPEGRIMDKCGVEGMFYNMVDGKVTFTDLYMESGWNAKFWETYNGLDLSVVDYDALLLPQAQKSLEMAKQYYSEDVDVVLPDDMQPYYDSVFALFNDYSTSIILGQQPIEYFDEFVEQYYQNGGEQLAEYLATVIK